MLIATRLRSWIRSTFEQIELTATQLGDVKNYLAPGGKVDVLFVDERPVCQSTCRRRSR